MGGAGDILIPEYNYSGSRIVASYGVRNNWQLDDSACAQFLLSSVLYRLHGFPVT